MANSTSTQKPVSQAKTASGINIVAGIWLVLAPFLLGYSAIPESTWNDVLVGIAVVILAGIKVARPLSAAGISWITAILGIWLIAAPFALGYETGEALWNDIIVGCIIAICAIWSAMAVREPARRAQHDVGRGTAARGAP